MTHVVQSSLDSVFRNSATSAEETRLTYSFHHGKIDELIEPKNFISEDDFVTDANSAVKFESPHPFHLQPYLTSQPQILAKVKNLTENSVESTDFPPPVEDLANSSPRPFRKSFALRVEDQFPKPPSKQQNGEPISWRSIRPPTDITPRDSSLKRAKPTKEVNKVPIANRSPSPIRKKINFPQQTSAHESAPELTDSSVLDVTKTKESPEIQLEKQIFEKAKVNVASESVATICSEPYFTEHVSDKDEDPVSPKPTPVVKLTETPPTKPERSRSTERKLSKIKEKRAKSANSSGVRYLPENMDTDKFIERRLPYTIEAQHYSENEIGPTEQSTGVPLALHEQVENKKEWYKQWHKAANAKQETDDDEFVVKPLFPDEIRDFTPKTKDVTRNAQDPHHINNFKPRKPYVSENNPENSLKISSQYNNAPDHIKKKNYTPEIQRKTLMKSCASASEWITEYESSAQFF